MTVNLARVAIAPTDLAPQRVSSAEEPIRPFLKWAGGKRRLLPRLLPYVPVAINRYFEPFVGGGAMFFALRDRVSVQSRLADLNAELVNTWQAVQVDPDGLHSAFATYRERDSEGFYYEVRGWSPQTRADRAARFVYLNQTSWNGLWRVNRLGEYNVPWGARAFRGIGHRQLLAVQASLTDVTIVHSDFREELATARQGDFVYLDPPYLPVSDTSKFSFYTEQRFRAPDLADLASLCSDLTNRGVHWMMSNRDTPLVRDLFGHASITPLTARRSVSAQNRRDVEPIDSPEVIVVGVP